MIIFMLIFVLFFVFVISFIAWDMLVLSQPKKLYRIDYGYVMPSDFTLIRAKTAYKAVKKFERKHPLARIYSVEQVEEF